MIVPDSHLTQINPQSSVLRVFLSSDPYLERRSPVWVNGSFNHHQGVLETLLRLSPPASETLVSKGVPSLRFPEVELILIQRFGLGALPLTILTFRPSPPQTKPLIIQSGAGGGETSAPVL